MTPKQFSTTLTRLGFTQSSFARHVDLSDRQIRNWLAGVYPVPKQTVLLLELMLKAQSMTKDLPS
jgi:DNA-binding transcriptional regulator YiaG